MNATTNLHDCRFWTRGQLNPANYDAISFKYIGGICMVLNCLSFPISSLGNLLVVIVMLKTPTLRTTANTFIGSLAVSDFLIGSVMQPMMIAVLANRSLFIDCDFEDSLTFLGLCLTSTSTTLMAAVSCERYMCLYSHLRYSSLVTINRCFIIIFLVLVYWLADAIMFLFGGEVFITAQVFCALAWVASPTAIGFCYFKILRLVQHHRNQIQCHTIAAQSTTNQAKLAVTMGYVIWASLACYTPTTIVTQMYIFDKTPNSHLFNAFYFTMTIQVMSSALNPVIYCLRRQDIRNAVKTLFRRNKFELNEPSMRSRVSAIRASALNP